MIDTDKGVFYIDHSINSKTKGALYKRHPKWKTLATDEERNTLKGALTASEIPTCVEDRITLFLLSDKTGACVV